MALDPSSPRSRRALLSAAVAATAVTVVEAVARPLPVAAANGDNFILAGENTTTAQTSLVNTTVGATVLAVGATNGIAVEGFGGASIGIRGHATSGFGVSGGTTTGVGVQGNALSGTGVAGVSFDGTGVFAKSDSGTALLVLGKTHTSRSGRAAVTAGHKSVTVSVEGGLAGTPLSFANLSSYRPGVAVAAVRPNFPSAGKMRIYLTKVMTSSTSVSWMVMD